MKMKACSVVVLCVVALIAMTAPRDDVFEAMSEFTIDVSCSWRDSEMGNYGDFCEKFFNTYLPRWRSEDFMVRVVRQYRGNDPSSTVTDKEIIETLAGVELKQVPRSRLVTIAVRSKSPELAAALANAYAEAIESFTDEENMKRCELLNARKENKADGLQAEKAVIKQSLQNTMMDISTVEKREKTASEWVGVLQAVQKAAEKSVALPAEVPRRSELATTYAKLQAVKAELATLKTRYTSVHPDVVAKECKLNEVAAEFADVIERALRTAQGDLEVYQKQLKDFRHKSEELRKKIKELDQKSVLADAGLKSLEAEKIISCKVYQDLLQKENEARIAAELNNVIIRVGRRAQIPSRPIGSLSQRNPAAHQVLPPLKQ